MRPGSLAILGVAAYSVFLVATMPARWLAARVMPPEPSRIALQEVEGTVWRGSARVLVGSFAGTFSVDRLEWRFLPSRLLQARAAAHVTARGQGYEARAELGRGLDGWTVRDLSGRAQASIATTLLPLVGAWRPEGRLEVSAASLDVWPGRARGTLRLDWADAAVALSDVKPIGSWRAQVEANGPGADVNVSTLSGPLRVSGQGRVEWPSRFTFTGEARAEGEKAQALQPLLDLLGPARPDGSRTISWRTR